MPDNVQTVKEYTPYLVLVATVILGINAVIAPSLAALVVFLVALFIFVVLAAIKVR